MKTKFEIGDLISIDGATLCMIVDTTTFEESRQYVCNSSDRPGNESLIRAVNRAEFSVKLPPEALEGAGEHPPRLIADLDVLIVEPASDANLCLNSIIEDQRIYHIYHFLNNQTKYLDAFDMTRAKKISK